MDTIKTSKVSGRRKLRFESIDDLIREVDSILAADSSGSLTMLGNWKLGQTLSHLAAWAEYPYKGYPLKPPVWPIRALIKLMVPGILKNGMRAGLKIPGVPGGTTGVEDQSVEQAASRYKSALHRLARGEPVAFDSPAFGRLVHADVIRLQLRHAELHLSFVVI